MKKLFNEVARFSEETFPDAIHIDHLKKLQKEAAEAIEDPLHAHEYVDCLIALFAACHAAGISYNALMYLADIKLQINKRRQWAKQADGTYQHIK
jgi:hypothetical protein